MNSAPNPTDSSLLLWLVAAGIAVLGMHVAMRWALLARRTAPLWGQWRALLASALALGLSLTAAALLSSAAQGLMFPIGYPPLWVTGLVLGTLVLSLPVVAALAASERWWLVVPAGLLLGGLAVAQQLGWLTAAGFRPGITWRPTLLAAGVMTELLGAAAAAWIAFTNLAKESQRRRWWLVGAAGVAGLGIAGGQELLNAAAGLEYQVDSIYRSRVPNSVLCLVAGVLVPLGLVLASVDLMLRAPLRGSVDNVKKRRRRRRHRIRAL